MNKSFFLSICLLLSLVCCVFQPTEARPLNLAKTAKKLLSILGTGTYYDVAAGVGSCGQTNSNDDMVVAVNHGQMKNGANPNKNKYCNKKVKIVGKTGKSVEARIVDTCPGCANGCLDMSSACNIQKVCGSLDLGVCQISWDFV
ncbi:RlpA-like double-psi beta-barrel-protein domain-containing protein-containing protein [Mucor lusitanicus]